jgi:hypothetical protein
MKYKITLVSLIVLLMIGCQSNEVIELKADLQEFETSLRDANNKIEGLIFLNNNLKIKLEKATSEYTNLHIQKTETDEWVGYMIKGVGPCVWASGHLKRPIPREMVKNASAKDLITKLNKIFKSSNSPEATLLRVKSETAYIKIYEEEKLTQRMGSFGATSYLNSIIYTLYSVESIKCVDFDFKEGDHAFPGTFCPGQDYKKENPKSI